MDEHGLEEYHVSYNDLLVAEWKHQVKVFIDWFVVKYNRFIEGRCRKAAIKIGMPELWDDLKSESIIEAYAIGERFDPNKGDLLKLLISSLWLFPMRHDKVNKVKSYSTGEITDIEYEATLIHFSAIDDPAPVYSLDKICSSLEVQDQLLMAFKYKLNLPNTFIGALCGLNESTIRSRLENCILKIQTKIIMKDDRIIGGL